MARRLKSHLPGPIWLCLAASCVLPTDRSDTLNVVILNETTEVVAGDTLRLAAELRHAGGEVVPSATIDFRSDDATVGIVDSTGTFRAIAAGNATIIARALEFEGAVPDSATLTVLAALDIIDVRPRTVRFGEVISIAGFGLDPSRITGVTIGGVSAPIEGFTRVNPTDPTSFDTLRVWVPAPAAALSDVVIRRGGAAGRRTIAVTQEDLFEPNDDAPAVLPIPFRNPALAVEAGIGTFDWYRPELDGTQSLTLKIVTAGDDIPVPVLFGFTNPLLTTDAPDWAILWLSSVNSDIPERGVQFCNGLGLLFPSDLSSDSAIIALRDVPPGTIDIVASILEDSLSTPAAYGISIEEGYISALPPDSREEDDYCDAASEISIPTVDTLTIDNPGDVDWFRFTVDSDAPDVTFAVSTSGSADLSMALYEDTTVIDPETGLLFEIAGSVRTGNLDSLSASLDPGRYLLFVWNETGEPADYVLSASTGAPAPLALISAGWDRTCALTLFGEAWCWGQAPLGDGTGVDSETPVAVAGGISFQSISAGGHHTCGVTTGGVGYCWGSGPLGVAGVTSSLVPIRITYP